MKIHTSKTEFLESEIKRLRALVRAQQITIDKLEAQPAPVQEPVAWMTINEYGEEDDIHYENPEGHLMEGWTYKPLYTHPPTAQSEQEPLEYWNAVEGWVKIDEVRDHFDSVGCGTIYKTAGEDRVPVYTTPPQRTWVGLTKDEKETLSYKAEGNTWTAVELAEAKLKDKNNV
jgi:hypothetical protein